MVWGKQEHILFKASHYENPLGRQLLSKLVQRLGWVAPAYHGKEDATPHPGAHKHSLQYDGRTDWRFGAGWDVEFR